MCESVPTVDGTQLTRLVFVFVASQKDTSFRWTMLLFGALDQSYCLLENILKIDRNQWDIFLKMMMIMLIQKND